MKIRQWAITTAIAVGLAIVGLTAPRADAQAPATTGQPASGATTRAAIEQAFTRDLAQVETAKIQRLAALAAVQPKAEAMKTYEDLFRFAIGTGLYNQAEPVAESVLKAGDASTEVVLLAEMVNIVAEASRGAYEQSLGSLAAAIQLRKTAATNGDAEKVKRVLPLAARLSLVNVYTQKLIQAGQYDVARKALTMIRETTTEPGIKLLVTGRLAQIELVGKPAPAIEGKDLDGRPAGLNEEKGNVVLVVFWASWCLPNAQEADRFSQIASAYRDKGFRILGVNLDTLQDGGVSPESVMPNVRRFLVDHNATWPNLMNGKGDQDFAKAYGVNELPTNVLVGRDGKVIHVDLTVVTLESVLARVIGQ